MIHRKGDVFTTEAAYIGHGVNLQGLMGRGIAKTIRETYEDSYNEYKNACQSGDLSLGSVLITDEGERRIVHLATQTFPGPDARYDAVFDATIEAAQIITNECLKYDRSPVLAIPQIGCGIGGLSWEKVETLLKAVEILVPGFQFEVWKL